MRLLLVKAYVLVVESKLDLPTLSGCSCILSVCCKLDPSSPNRSQCHMGREVNCAQGLYVKEAV